MNMFKRIIALAALGSFAGCGACNCGLPGASAVAAISGPTPVPGATATAAAGVVPTPVPAGTPVPVVVLPPGVVPPAPTPPPATLACNQGGGAIVLGPALAPFAILAGSTVTNTGNTIVTYASGAVTGGINDDRIGVSPGTAVTGFYPPGTDADGPTAIYATGAGYSNIPAVPLAAQTALTAAYNTAAGVAQTNPNFPGGQDLSQVTLPNFPTGTITPGVYKSASTLSIAAGNLTLNGLGNPQSVFVFQMGSALNTGPLNGTDSGNVILTNGASACNIYWQVGSSAVLQGQTFYGNVLAAASVTLTSSTAFTGRALARSGAVTISAGSLITNPGGN